MTMGYFAKPSIVAQITNYCNARCEHCFNAYHVENVKSTSQLDIDAFLGFLDRFTEQLCAKPPYIGISGGGEPTIHKRFLDLTAGLAERGVYFGVVTNGLHWKRWLVPLHNSAAAKFFYRAHFSFYGEKAIHDKITGVKSFDSIVQALRFCRENNIDRQLHIAIDKTNIGNIPEIIRFIVEEDVNCGCAVGPVYATPFLDETGLMLDKEDLALLRRYRKNVGGGLRIGGTETLDMPTGRVVCDELDGDKFSVNFDGELCLCCSLIGLAFNQNRTEVFGTIYDTDLVETFSRREDIITRWRKEFVRATGEQEIRSYQATKCNWCIREFFDKIPGAA